MSTQLQLANHFGWVGRVKACAGSHIVNSLIQNSVVKELPDPIDAQDPVTLHYLQYYTQSFTPFYTFNFTGTDWHEVSADILPWFGLRNVSINATAQGAPNAQWQIARSNPNDFGAVTQGVFSPNDADCVLQLRWLPATLVQIRKTTNEYDGVYELSVTR